MQNPKFWNLIKPNSDQQTAIFEVFYDDRSANRDHWKLKSAQPISEQQTAIIKNRQPITNTEHRSSNIANRSISIVVGAYVFTFLADDSSVNCAGGNNTYSQVGGVSNVSNNTLDHVRVGFRVWKRKHCFKKQLFVSGKNKQTRQYHIYQVQVFFCGIINRAPKAPGGKNRVFG